MALIQREIVSPFGLTAIHKWLEESLRQSGMSQKRLASLLDIDPPQLNRILSGAEAVPDRMLVHACRIFGLDDTDTGILLACADVYHAQRDYQQMIEKACKRYPQEGMQELLCHVQKVLFDVSSTLHKRSFLLGPLRSLQRLTGFLRDADLLTRILIRTYLGEDGVLITPENTAFHLRQPLSAFVGAMMKAGLPGDGQEISELRSNILSEFRKLANQSYKSGSGIDYAQQHAVHMLSRYGMSQDRKLTDRYLKFDDILARRMAIFGGSLGGSPDFNSILHDLVHDDPYFLQAVASFDAVHYGDAALVNGRLPGSVNRLETTISNSLAYIIQEVKEEDIDLNFIKLTAFLKKFGSDFIKEGHISAVRSVLQIISTSNHLSASRREFQLCFQKILPR